MEEAKEVKFHVPPDTCLVYLPGTSFACGVLTQLLTLEKAWGLSVDVELPLIPAHPNPYKNGIKKTANRPHQITLSEWTSFIPHALAFDMNEFKQPQNWWDAVSSSIIRDHEETVDGLKVNVGRFFNGSSLGSITVKDRPENRRQWLMIGDAELVGRNLDGEICRICLIFNFLFLVKVPWAIEIKEKRLVTLFNERRLHEPTAHAIAHVVGYMVDNSCKYGVLSTYNETRFLCAMDRDNVAISEVVLADAETVKAAGPSSCCCSVTLRRAFGYWLHLCTQPDGRLSYYNDDESATATTATTTTTAISEEPLLKKRHVDTHPSCGLCCAPTAEGSSLQSSSHDALQSSLGPARQTSCQDLEGLACDVESKCHTTTTNQEEESQGSLALVTNHRLFVPWSELQIIDLLGTGRSGSVVLARRGGEGEEGRGLEFALKLFDVGKSVEGFEQELRAYMMLQTTDAKAAKLLLVTHSPSGQVFGLGLQLGRPLPPLASWSRKHRKGAMAALRSLLAVGIVQNDVREYNFIDNNGQVLAIDFEDIAMAADDKDGDGHPLAYYLKSAWEYFTE